MSGSLVHSPSEILRDLLVTLGLGTLPSAGGSWPIFIVNLPDSPDSVILITDTTGRKQGRLQNDGEVQETYGLQVMVRDANHQDGFEKADAIKEALDKSIRLNSVDLLDNVGTGTSTYIVYNVSRTTGIIALGYELPTSKRNLFTINAVVSLRQTA